MTFLGASLNFQHYVLLFLVLICLCVAPGRFAQEATCCSRATGSCRSACEQMSLVAIAADNSVREKRLQNVQNFCSSQLVSFWQCMNETLEEISKGEGWSGRACCPLPQSEKCQHACVTAARRQDLVQSCRQSDELAFFTCLDRQEIGEECCGNAKTTECHQACRAIFRSQLTPSREARSSVIESCSDQSPKVLQCVKNFTRVTPTTNPHKYLHCCDKAGKKQCRDSCRRILRIKTTGQEIVDSLQEGGCGPPLPHDVLWQCFLQSSESAAGPTTVEVSRIDRMGMDSAKLHCCSKAESPTCRRLCLKTFSNEWTRSWDEFDRECLSELSEDSLFHCIDEVEEPCELGCEGLSYCTNFNNRPTDLFRSCTLQADDAARYDVALWQQQGYLGLPGLQLPVRNISRCSPNMWKAVACALQIKPCHRHTHANRICREDCYELLSQCMDWSRMPTGHNAASLCSRLSPENPDTPCISLRPFLEPSDNPYLQPQDEVTSPCKGDPCNNSEVCSVNRNCATGRPCLPYQCSPGCKLGEVSQYLVPQGSYVRIPLAAGQKGCLKICQCSPQGVVERCQLMPCYPLDSCWLGNRKIEHSMWFYMDCNICSCYAGEITCRKKQCEVTSLGGLDPAYTSLPCNCPPHHVPVCGRNGDTYPSSCLARCAGLKDADFEFGSCSEKDPCDPNPCSDDKQCIPARKVCLSLLHKPCPQFQCVDVTAPCTNMPHDPVCDTDGQEHPNVCYLIRYRKALAYTGPCLVNCENDGPVCGIDGETYLSECGAHANLVSVDYRGPCIAVGLIGDQAKLQCSDSTVKCLPLARLGCMGITPPGACCPVCGGSLRLLYSQKQVDRALYALRGNAVSALTVKAVLQSLERQVQVAECAVRGYLTVEMDLFVLVQAVGRNPPSELQLEACEREAEKLANLVQGASPRVLSELSLSSLTTATIVHIPVRSSVVNVLPLHWVFGVVLVCLIFIFS
ncbi:reversion-inducing cysteine-rich protein with Kazal motifs isoform X1 [Zootermopsis nevadensis]|uniref:reversion-inducing cysteine-rich protein with Kazal motifs isoform X1 n=1 Tax=Zootermopsis nevadensis TaxID=136037 RepID=UPI000B8E9BAA|nr:reversion-inducing cysteine-rich protein with Kazal motifs isoform X1 [Zootermopsis nevadensis]